VLPVAAFACADTLDGDSSDGSGAGGAENLGGGSAQCAKKECGEPCSTCKTEPCNPQICDGNGECGWLNNVTCTECPNGDDYISNGDMCPYEGLVCEYGGLDELADCRDRYECTVNGWDYNSDLSEASDCNYWSGGTCPMNIPEAGADCDPLEYYKMCDYPEANAYCACSKCAAGNCEGTTGKWYCATPPDGCPTAPGLIGHFCTEEGLICTYGDCALEDESNPAGADLITAQRTCTGGMWVETPIADLCDMAQ
jgi:hypothetical protein